VAFFVLQVASLAFSLVYFGFIRIYYNQVISSEAANAIYSYLFILMPAAYLFFYRSLLQEYKPPIRMMRILLILQFYPFLGLILMLNQQQQLALHLNALIALTSFSILSIVSICVFKNRRKIDQNKLISPLLVAISCWLFTVGSITIILPGLGVVDASDLSLYRFTFQSFFSALIIGSTVYLRTKKMEQSNNLALARANEEAYFERKRREEQNVFFAMLTHEIRTPLTAMAYSVQTAMPQNELKKQIERGVKEIDNIIEHCSQADRIEEGKYEIDRNSIHLSELIKTAIEKCQTKNRIHTNAMPNLVIETDAALALVVLNNLIENALKYSDHNSVVSISCEVETLNNQTGVSISIMNQLGQFDLPDPKRLFEKYYRSPSAHAITGSGLGLFLVRSFVKTLGGNVSYHPIENKVTFKVWLPL
jgi:signal transduction histidine kinase